MASNGFTSKDLYHETRYFIQCNEDTKKTFIAQNKKYENVFWLDVESLRLRGIKFDSQNAPKTQDH